MYKQWYCAHGVAGGQGVLYLIWNFIWDKQNM